MLRKYKTPAFLFVLFVSISPRLKTHESKTSYPRREENAVGKKEENPRRFLPPSTPLPFRPDGEYKVRYNPDAQPYSYGFNLLSQPPGFMGPQVLLAHPRAPLTPRVYPCAYASPAVRFSPILRISTSTDARSDVGETFFTKNLVKHSGLGRENMSFVCPVNCRKIVASHICTIAILRMKRSRSF